MRSIENAAGRILSIVLASAVALAGCSSGAKKGGALGGAIGAATGAVIGHQGKHTGTGAATGAVVGAAAGAIIGDYMERQKKELEKVPGADVKREGDKLVVTFENAILFDFDSYTLKEESQKNLHEMADVLVKYPDTDLVVEGHTDNVGTENYNQRLSEQRADAVRAFLAAHGVAADRLVARGYGESRPVASNDSEDGRAQNRRVQVQIAANADLQRRDQESRSGAR